MPNEQTSVLEYWLFWYWQYLSRNKSYRTDWKIVTHGDYDFPENYEGEHVEEFIDRYFIQPKAPTEDNDSDTILSEALSGKVNHSVTIEIKQDLNTDDTLKAELPSTNDHTNAKRTLEKTSASRRISKLEAKQQTIVKQLLSDIDNLDITATDKMAANFSQAQEAIVANRYKLLDALRKESKQNAKRLDIPRAIGIWLWDKREKNKVKSIDAIKEFLSSDYANAAGIENKEERQLRKYLEVTAESIEKLEVVAISA